MKMYLRRIIWLGDFVGLWTLAILSQHSDPWSRVLLFLIWATTPIVWAFALLYLAVAVAGSDGVAFKDLRRSVPAWLDNTMDLSVCLFLAYIGRPFTAFAYATQIAAGFVAFELAVGIAKSRAAAKETKGKEHLVVV